MHADPPTPPDANDEALRQMVLELESGVLSPREREALLRRILLRIGGSPPLAPASAAKDD